ncbi:MAG: hypothetical protein HYX69_06030 [Planctomycetia bacterium]|nr:hypothetical protein [Planctomycetia bacterium]
MHIPAPHFFLFSQANGEKQQGEWSFVLKAADGSAQWEAADAEPEIRGERLELLAVVRGLEALDQPSRVTLVTPSRYVNSGISYGLDEWGRNDWNWECFGEMVPVKNRDLWQRLDRALRIHRIEGAILRHDPPHAPGAACDSAEGVAPGPPVRGLRAGLRSLLAALGHRLEERAERAWLFCAQLGTSLLPSPWLD